MLEFRDNFVRGKYEYARNLIESGKFVVDRSDISPILSNKSVGVVHSYERYVDGQTTWGKFSSDYKYGFYTLDRGEIPEKYLPQKKPFFGKAVVHKGFITITTDDGRSIDADIEITTTNFYNALNEINNNLWGNDISVVIYEVVAGEDYDEGKSDVIRVKNDHVDIVAESVVYDDIGDTIVALQIIPDNDSLKSLKASLAGKGNKSYILAEGANFKHYAYGAGRGYLTLGKDMSEVDAIGAVILLLHPLSGDPKGWASDHLYVLGTGKENIEQEIVKRLNIVLSIPLLDEWGSFLVEAGKQKRLVRNLEIHGTAFSNGYRIESNEERWAEIVQNGLKNKVIGI